MAVETFQAPTGQTWYVFLIDPATGFWWNGSAFEAYNASNYATYVVTSTEYGTTGVFRFTVPASLPSGTFAVGAKQRAGGSPAQSDPNGSGGGLEWNGTAVVPLSTLATLAQAVKILAAVYDSLAASGNVLTLSNAATQTINLTTGARTTVG